MGKMKRNLRKYFRKWESANWRDRKRNCDENSACKWEKMEKTEMKFLILKINLWDEIELLKKHNVKFWVYEAR